MNVVVKIDLNSNVSLGRPIGPLILRSYGDLGDLKYYQSKSRPPHIHIRLRYTLWSQTDGNRSRNDSLNAIHSVLPENGRNSVSGELIGTHGRAIELAHPISRPPPNRGFEK